MTTLDRVKPGHGGVIASIGGEGALRRRLLDMGLTPKTRVEVRKVAPMGDPIELYLRGYVLTLRGEDAAKITLLSDTETPKAQHGHCHGHHHHCEGCPSAQKQGEELIGSLLGMK